MINSINFKILIHKERKNSLTKDKSEDNIDSNQIKLENYTIRQRKSTKVDKLLPVKYSAFVLPAKVKNIDIFHAQNCCSIQNQKWGLLLHFIYKIQNQKV